MELKPEIGIDNIIFGMSQSEIEEILGKPDRKRIDEDAENRLIWDFNKQKLRLTFYQNENSRLGYIETSNTNLAYNGLKIVNSNFEFVNKEVFGNIIKDWDIEEYHSFTTFFNEKYWLTLHVEYEEVTNIELGVTFINDEEYKWPNRT